MPLQRPQMRLGHEAEASLQGKAALRLLLSEGSEQARAGALSAQNQGSPRLQEVWGPLQRWRLQSTRDRDRAPEGTRSRTQLPFESTLRPH